MAEELLFEGDGVRITSTRATIYSTTYPINGITSVRVARKSPSIGVPVIVMTCGSFLGFLVLCFGTSMVSQTGQSPGVMSALVVPGSIVLGSWALGLWMISRGKGTYNVVLGTAGGDRRALGTKDKWFAEDVKDAIERAVIQRG